MWFSNKSDLTLQKEMAFEELISEIKHAAPCSRLSYHLRNRLEKFPRDIRREIASGVENGITALFLASKRGLCEIVEYLIKECDVDLEQRGLYEVADDRSVHCVTPLWCAAVSGKMSVIKCLVENGADVNAISDTGSTPVRSACFMTHLDIVSYLVEHGADILRPNFNGGTCLINSVQSVQLCLFLLKHGASVNTRDIQNKTALHYAIQEHRFETTNLLLDHGADPLARSRYNDDALQTACLKGATQIFELLINRVQYTNDRLADAHELLGSTFLDEHNDILTAMTHWRFAMEIRWSKPDEPILKPYMEPRACFRNAVEFNSLADLENVANDLDQMRVQSLLICERILGPHHKDTLFRIMYRGAAYADALRYQRCIDLWRRALEIRVEKDTILYNDTCFTAQALVRLFVDLCERHLEGRCEPRFQDVASIFKLLTEDLIKTIPLLQIRPEHKRQQESHDKTLSCLTHLIHLLITLARTPEENDTKRVLVERLISYRPLTFSNSDTLLHLCVSPVHNIKSTYFGEDIKVVFPNLDVVKFLIECGADVNIRNQWKNSPLHIATTPLPRPDGKTLELVQILLNAGAHVDLPNKDGDTPIKQLQIFSIFRNYLPLLKYNSLRCMSARAVLDYHIPYRGEIPVTLESFVDDHACETQ